MLVDLQRAGHEGLIRDRIGVLKHDAAVMVGAVSLRDGILCVYSDTQRPYPLSITVSINFFYTP